MMSFLFAHGTVLNIDSDGFSYELLSINPPEVALTDFNVSQRCKRIDVPEKISAQVGEFNVVEIRTGHVDTDTLVVPKTIRYINPAIFESVHYCFIVDNQNEQYADVSGALYTKDRKKLLRWPNFKDFDNNCRLYENVETLGNRSFSFVQIYTKDCNFLPPSISKIENGCFEGCRAYTPIVYIPENVVEIGDSVFYYSGFNRIFLSKNTTRISRTAFENFDGIVELSEDNKTLGMFSNILYDKETGEVLFPINSTSTTIEFPEYINKVPEINLPQLKTVTFLNPDIELEDFAFALCGNLEQVELPKNIVSINKGVFSFTDIKQINFPETVRSIGDRAFGNTKLTNVILPESINRLGTGVFEYTSLTDIQLPSSIKEIPERFCRGTRLADVEIPKNVVKIGAMAFANARLKKIDLNGSVEEIGDSAFISNPLTEVHFSNDLKKIGAGTFKNTTLTQIKLHGNVQQIGSEAFLGCKILQVDMESSTPPDIFDDSFGSYTYMFAKLTVPVGALERYKTAPGWRMFKNITESSGVGVGVLRENEEESSIMYDLSGKKVDKNHKGMVLLKNSDNIPASKVIMK